MTAFFGKYKDSKEYDENTNMMKDQYKMTREKWRACISWMFLRERLIVCDFTECLQKMRVNV